MRTLFKFNIQSFSDIITNSSSELFVFQKDSVGQVIQLLDKIYPNWRTEYREPILFKDMTEEDQRNYIYWVGDVRPYYSLYNEDDCKRMNPEEALVYFNNHVIKYVHRKWNIPKEEVPSMYSNWSELKYTRDNYPYIYLELSEKGIKMFKSLFEDDICLWSIDENPNWEKQEEISLFAKRYHLG